MFGGPGYLMFCFPGSSGTAQWPSMCCWDSGAVLNRIFLWIRSAERKGSTKKKRTLVVSIGFLK